MNNKGLGLITIIIGIILWYLAYIHFNNTLGLEFKFLIESWIAVWSTIIIYELILDFGKQENWIYRITNVVILFLSILAIVYISTTFLGLSIALIAGILLGALLAIYMDAGIKLMMGKKIE